MKHPIFRLLLGLFLILGLARCGSHKALAPADPPPSEPISQAISPPIDSLVVTPHRTALDKVLGRTPQADIHALQLPGKIGKKSTVSIYYGPATVTTVGKKATAATAEGATAVVAAKKAGPVVLADSGASVQVATTKKGQAAAGKDINQRQTETKKSLLATLLPGLGILAGIAAVYWLVAGGGLALLAALWRKNKPTDTTA